MVLQQINKHKNTHLIYAKNFPSHACKGTQTIIIPIPAKPDGPNSNHNIKIAAITASGATQR